MLERAIDEGADAFLTGEMKYNDYWNIIPLPQNDPKYNAPWSPWGSWEAWE